MNRNGWNAKLIHYTGFMASAPSSTIPYDFAVGEWLREADLIIVQRNIIMPDVVNAMKYWQAVKNKVVVVDLDDAYHMLDASNPALTFWHENREQNHAMDYLIEGLSISDGLIAPNRNLLNDFNTLAGVPGYYLQNYAEKDWWTDLPSRDEMKKKLGLEGRIVIGWGGSVSHFNSFVGSGVMEAAGLIAKRYPEVTFLICGNDGRILENLPVPASQLQHQDSVPPSEWPKVVKTYDIGMAPLFWDYDHRRSWLKGIEYALAGVPWIGSGGGVNATYSDLAHLGTLVKNTELNWYNALQSKIDNLGKEQIKAERFIPQAQKLFIADNQTAVFEAVYRQIIGDTRKRGRIREGMPGVVHI